MKSESYEIKNINHFFFYQVILKKQIFPQDLEL